MSDFLTDDQVRELSLLAMRDPGAFVVAALEVCKQAWQKGRDEHEAELAPLRRQRDDLRAAATLALRYLEHPDVAAMPFVMSSVAAAGRVRAAIAAAETATTGTISPAASSSPPR